MGCFLLILLTISVQILIIKSIKAEMKLFTAGIKTTVENKRVEIIGPYQGFPKSNLFF